VTFARPVRAATLAHTASASLTYSCTLPAYAIEPTANWCWTLAAPNNGRGEKMQREHDIRQLAKREGYRLEKKDDDSYRLINARFNVAVYQHDGVPLKKIAEFLERRTSQVNLPDRYNR
jgi:hypothetical protein